MYLENNTKHKVNVHRVRKKMELLYFCL